MDSSVLTAIPRLEDRKGVATLPRMESHEWRERTEDGVRFWRANRHAGRWSFQTTLKHEPDWDPIEPVPRELWEALRDVLWRKYQRKRCPWEHIEKIDKILEDPDEFPEVPDR